MPRPCSTCQSPHVEEIDQLILGGWAIKELERYLKGTYPGENHPSYHSLRNHKTHLEAMVERGVESNLERKRIIRSEINKNIGIAKSLHENLVRLNTGINAVFEEWVVTRQFSRLKELGSLINSCNRTIELLLKFQSELRTEQLTEEQVFDRIMYCIEDFPTEYVVMFKERWEDYNGNQ